MPRISVYPPRVLMHLRDFGIRSIPLLGYYNSAHANGALNVHRHLGAIEICYLVRGLQTFYVDSRRFCMQGGDVFMTFPDEEHSTGGEPIEKGQLYWLVLVNPSKTRGSLLGLPIKESRALWRALMRISRHRHFPGTGEMKTHFDAITRMVHSPGTYFTRLAVGNRLIALLLEVLAAHNDSSDGSRRQFENVLAHIESHLEQPDELVVEKLAVVAGLSTSRFKARFKEATGIPPAEFALRARIREAERRLAQRGATVTDVAYELGFSSSQYFASVFKRFTHNTPRAAMAMSQGRLSSGRQVKARK